MNRRSFLLGLLSSTAAPAIAKAMPALIHEPSYARIRTGLPAPAWRLMYQGVPIREVESLAEWGSNVEYIIKEWMIVTEGSLPSGTKTVIRGKTDV